MDFKQSITDEDLPREWNSVIVPEKRTEDRIYIRCNISNLDDIKAWVDAFSRNTSTQWKARSSKPNPSIKLVCQKIYVCHHSSYQKRPTDERNHNKRGISKNTSCLASMTLSVKITSRYTKRRDPYIKDGLPGVIIIRRCHNHPLDSAYALKCLTPLEHVKEKFLEYFKLGMSISAACRYHENTLVFDNFNEDKDIESVLNNSRLNPAHRMVQHWFSKWKKVDNDPRDGSFIKEKLNAKISTYYESEGTIIKYIDTENDPFTMVVFTPIMQRMHRSVFSKGILFIDSASCCYAEKYSITFLLSPTPCGVVPCGVLVTKDQTEESFENGFRLFQDITKETLGSSFYQQNYPSVIISDDFIVGTVAENVWPASTSFLCTFRVLQCVSLWLEDEKNGIPEERRRDLLSTFQTTLYCADRSEAENAFESAMAIGADYPEWQDYLRDLYTLKEKWCLAYRVGVTTHFMSKHVDISIRLYKETILNRVKKYNIIILTEFIASTMESFYRKKLLNFYDDSEDSESHSYLRYVFQEADRMQKENIVLIDEHTYGVPCDEYTSASGAAMYSVDIRRNTCNCKIGLANQLCKHVAAVYRAFYSKNDTSTVVTVEDRHAMASIAVEEDNVFNYSLPVSAEKMKTVKLEINECDIDNICMSPCASPENYATTVVKPKKSTFDEMLTTMRDLHEKFGSSASAKKALSKLLVRLKEIKTGEDWVNFLHCAAGSPLRQRSVIRVQPSVIQRRKLQRARRHILIRNSGNIIIKK